MSINRKTEIEPSDTQRIRRSFSRAKASYETQAHMQDFAAERLAGLFERLSAGEPMERVLEIGAGSGLLTRRILACAPGVSYTANDITDAFADSYARWGCVPLIGDAQTLELPCAQDAVVSSSCLQWMRDLPSFFRKLHRSLRPGGLLCFSTFGPQHFCQVRRLTGAGLNYYSEQELAGMLRAAGFAVRELRCGKDTLRFDTAREMFRYFSATGVNGVGTCAGIWTPGRLADFERRYRAQYPDAAGGLPLTVDYLWAVAEKIE